MPGPCNLDEIREQNRIVKSSTQRCATNVNGLIRMSGRKLHRLGRFCQAAIRNYRLMLTFALSLSGAVRDTVTPLWPTKLAEDKLCTRCQKYLLNVVLPEITPTHENLRHAIENYEFLSRSDQTWVLNSAFEEFSEENSWRVGVISTGSKNLWQKMSGLLKTFFGQDQGSSLTAKDLIARAIEKVGEKCGKGQHQ